MVSKMACKVEEMGEWTFVLAQHVYIVCGMLTCILSTICVQLQNIVSPTRIVIG